MNWYDGTLAGYEEAVTGECMCVCHRDKYRGEKKKQCGHCHHMRYPEPPKEQANQESR